MHRDAVVLNYLLDESIKKCKRQGIKVAVQLSGGLDSALIQRLLGSKNLYCCTWVDQDNITLAKKAAHGSEVKPVSFTKDQMLDVLPEVKKLTNGQGTWSQVCQYFLNKQIAEDGCDLVLTGEGADELFGGYSRYRILWHLDQMFNDPRLEKYQGIIEHVIGTKRNVIQKMLSRTMGDDIADDLASKETIYCLTESISEIEKYYSLPSLLNFGESMAECHGIKCMFPFMDSSIQKFANALQESRKINTKWNKAILREIGLNLGIDEAIIYESTKKGLFIPQSWRPKDAPIWSRSWFEKLMESCDASSN